MQHWVLCLRKQWVSGTRKQNIKAILDIKVVSASDFTCKNDPLVFEPGFAAEDCTEPVEVVIPLALPVVCPELSPAVCTH